MYVSTFLAWCRYTLLVGKPPFETQSLKDTYQKIKRNEYRIPSYVSREARALITRLLQSEPTHRPSPSDILEDPFVTAGYLPAKLPTRCGCTCGCARKREREDVHTYMYIQPPGPMFFKWNL